MKHLIMAIFILMPVLSYAQTGDIEKAGNVLNDLYRKQNQSNNANSKRSSYSSPGSVRATATPGKVETNKVNVKSPEQYKKQFNNGMDAYNKANGESYKIGGKTPAQHATQLMNGDAPVDVTINYLKNVMINLPVTEQHKKIVSVKDKADSIKNVHYNDYSIQFRKTEDKIKSSGYSVTNKQVGEYVKLRMNGKKLNNVYPKELVDEVDKAAVKYRRVEKDKERIGRLQAYLNEIKAECGGKCE